MTFAGFAGMRAKLPDPKAARIFRLDRTRASSISLKTMIDRSHCGMLALLGLKLAAT